MSPKRNAVPKLVCGLAIILLASCDSVEVYRLPKPHPGPGVGHGPPAHAKAHGHRRKQACGYDLTYDADFGVYIVVGVADCYYHDGHFYRLWGEGWQISVRADSGWRPVAVHVLPPGLQKKSKVKMHTKAQVNTPAVVKIKARGHGRRK
jgi:hypothetical protein